VYRVWLAPRAEIAGALAASSSSACCLVGTAAAFPRLAIAELDSLVDESPSAAVPKRGKRGAMSREDGSD